MVWASDMFVGSLVVPWVFVRRVQGAVTQDQSVCWDPGAQLEGRGGGRGRGRAWFPPRSTLRWVRGPGALHGPQPQAGPEPLSLAHSFQAAALGNERKGPNPKPIIGSFKSPASGGSLVVGAESEGQFRGRARPAGVWGEAGGFPSPLSPSPRGNAGPWALWNTRWAQAPPDTHGPGPASWAALPSLEEFPQTACVSLVEVVNAAGVREPARGADGGRRG